MKSDKNMQKAIIKSCLDESTKVIRYLNKQEQRQKPYNLAVLVFTIISALGSVVAAITGILMCFQ